MGRLLAALIGLALTLSAPTAMAQDDPARWQAGVDLRAAGRDAEALDHFARMHDESGSPRTLAQVAFAEQALGRWGAAALHLDQARAEPDAWITERAAVIAEARAEIARHVGQLQLDVEGGPVEVELDGTAVGVTPLPGPVPATAGTVSLRLLRDGVPVAARRVTVQVGQLTREHMVVPGGAATGATGGAGGSSGVLGVLGWVSIGVGVASLGGVVVAWGMREGHAETYNGPDCAVEGTTRDEVCGGNRAAADRAQGAAIGFGIGAAVLVGLGVALVVAGSGGDDAQASVRCAPGLMSVACGGRF